MTDSCCWNKGLLAEMLRLRYVCEVVEERIGLHQCMCEIGHRNLWKTSIERAVD